MRLFRHLFSFLFRFEMFFFFFVSEIQSVLLEEKNMRNKSKLKVKKRGGKKGVEEDVIDKGVDRHLYFSMGSSWRLHERK